MVERLRQGLFFVAALPAMVRAALRLRRYGGDRLDALSERLRRVRPFRQRFLRNPRYLAACAHRLVALWPRRDMGPCLARSLLLLDLWSRCGLEPKLCLGIARAAGERRFHAWVRTGRGGLEVPAAYREIWSG